MPNGGRPCGLLSAEFFDRERQLGTEPRYWIRTDERWSKCAGSVLRLTWWMWRSRIAWRSLPTSTRRNTCAATKWSLPSIGRYGCGYTRSKHFRYGISCQVPSPAGFGVVHPLRRASRPSLREWNCTCVVQGRWTELRGLRDLEHKRNVQFVREPAPALEMVLDAAVGHTQSSKQSDC